MGRRMVAVPGCPAAPRSSSGPTRQWAVGPARRRAHPSRRDPASAPAGAAPAIHGSGRRAAPGSGALEHDRAIERREGAAAGAGS